MVYVGIKFIYRWYIDHIPMVHWPYTDGISPIYRCSTAGRENNGADKHALNPSFCHGVGPSRQQTVFGDKAEKRRWRRHQNECPKIKA